MNEVVNPMAGSACACCGADLTDQKHHKDRYGEPICPSCHRAGRRSPRAESRAEKKRRCIFCGVEISDRECHTNRYGEHVCLKCHGEGKRWSRSRSMRRTLRHSAKWLFYAVLAVLGTGLAYLLLVQLLKATTRSE